MQVRQVILDTNVIGGIAASAAGEQDAALARLAVAKRQGAQILVTGTIVHEIGATPRSETLEKLLQAVIRACDGWLDLEAPDILKLELTEADPYSIVTARKPLPIEQLGELKEVVKDEAVKKFYAEGGFGNDRMRHLLEKLDPIRKKVRDQIESFPTYVEARRLPCLSGMLEVAQDKGYIPKKDRDLEALWKTGAAWKFSTLVLLANEYRRLTLTQKKGEGSLSDLRIAMEAAYSHEVLTRDKEFVGCGELANKIVSKPTISPW